MYWDEKLTKDFVSEAMIANTGGWFIPTDVEEEFAWIPAEEMVSPTNPDAVFEWSDIDYQDILDFNDPVSRRDLSTDDKNRIAREKAKVMKDPNASVEDILQWSLWGKTVWQTQSQQLDKFGMAFGMLDEINGQLKDMNTGPIIWKMRKLNPYDTDRKVLEAALTGLVPTAARGIYWEVWVLTDTDIQHYIRTLPNLDNTRKQNEAILALNLSIFAWGYKKKLASLAWQNYDVSGLEWTYLDLMNKVSELQESSGMWQPWSEPDALPEDAPAEWTTEDEDIYNMIMNS